MLEGGSKEVSFSPVINRVFAPKRSRACKNKTIFYYAGFIFDAKGLK